MGLVRKLGLAALLVGVGYLWGAGGFGLRSVTAQQPVPGLDETTAGKIRTAHRALVDAMEALKSQGKFESITDGVNSYLVLAGGGNARADLESGRGVDPETFAALYSGKAIPTISPLLGVDEQGRVTYNNEVVRMYSKSRLQQLQNQKAKLLEVGL